MGTENTQFNAELYMDFMYIKEASVLYTVAEKVYLSAAQFADPLPTESVRKTILVLWETVYTVLPNASVFNDSSNFRLTFVEIYEIHGAE